MSPVRRWCVRQLSVPGQSMWLASAVPDAQVSRCSSWQTLLMNDLLTLELYLSKRVQCFGPSAMDLVHT